MLWIYCIKIYSLFIIYSVSLFNCYNLKRVNTSHFKAVDSRRFCYFYIFTNFPIPAGKCREMVSNPEASRKPRKQSPYLLNKVPDN